MKLQEIHQHVVEGDSEAAAAGVKAALEAGVDPEEILSNGLIAAMAEIGRLFEAGELFVPEMLIAARAMQSGLALLKPYLQHAGVKSAGIVAIGTVKGDLHDIGKNLVAMMLQGAGFEIRDLGTDTPPERFVQAARDGAQIVAMSALLTTTMPSIRTTVEALEAARVRQLIKILVGGAPVTQQFANEIGADGYAADASQAVAMAKQILQVV